MHLARIIKFLGWSFSDKIGPDIGKGICNSWRRYNASAELKKAEESEIDKEAGRPIYLINAEPFSSKRKGFFKS